MAERIRSARLKSSLSQLQLAREANLTQQMISKLESGNSQSTSAIFSIAKTLGVSAHWLWLGTENPNLGSTPFIYDDKILAAAWDTLSDQQRAEICNHIMQLSERNSSKQ